MRKLKDYIKKFFEDTKKFEISEKINLYQKINKLDDACYIGLHPDDFKDLKNVYDKYGEDKNLKDLLKYIYIIQYNGDE